MNKTDLFIGQSYVSALTVLNPSKYQSTSYGFQPSNYTNKGEMLVFMYVCLLLGKYTTSRGMKILMRIDESKPDCT